MRKNYIYSKRVGEVYTVYAVDGLNLDRFVNLVVKNGVSLYKIKNSSNKRITFCVNIKENKKFFAIINKLWYNDSANNLYSAVLDGKKLNLQGGYVLQKIKTAGIFNWVYGLIKNVGLLIGGLVFIVSTTLVNDVVLDVRYFGSGNTLKWQVQEYLSTQNIKKGARFSKIKLDLLADNILAENSSLSFVSCNKRGNNLDIVLELAESSSQIIDNNVKTLVSPQNGIVQEVKVYRGNPLVKVGDSVKMGDVLVDGNLTIKEVEITTNVLAKVVLLCNYTFEYQSPYQNMQDYAIILAQESLGEKQIVNSICTKTKIQDTYLYTVTLQYNVMVHSG